MTLSKRIDRLEEANPTTQTAIVFAEVNNPPPESVMEKLAKDVGGTGPFSFWVMPSTDPLAEPEIGFVGHVRDFLDDIAKHGKRIGETDEEWARRVC